jgi:hypothetical protein
MTTTNEILEKIASIFKPKAIKIKETENGYLVVLNYELSLNNHQLQNLMQIGSVEIKRSGAGLKLTIVILNTKS